MTELIIGSDGFIGGRLSEIIPEAETTTIKTLNLLSPGVIPQADVVYFCASVTGFKECEGNHIAYRTNVDGTLTVIRQLLKQGSFVVWLSSCASEWSHSAYGLQKSLVEIAIQMIPNTAIIRAGGKVTSNNVTDLCWLMTEVGRNKKEGITLWNVS